MVYIWVFFYSYSMLDLCLSFDIPEHLVYQLSLVSSDIFYSMSERHKEDFNHQFYVRKGVRRFQDSFDSEKDGTYRFFV